MYDKQFNGFAKVHGAREHNLKNGNLEIRGMLWSYLRASPPPVNHRGLLGLHMQKHNGITLNACRLMPRTCLTRCPFLK